MPAQLAANSTEIQTAGNFLLVAAGDYIQVLFLPSQDFVDLPVEGRIGVMNAVKTVCDQFIENAKNPPPPKSEMS